MQKDNKIKLLFIIDFIRTLTAGTENQLAKIINGLNQNKFEKNLYCLIDSEWIRSKADKILDCNVSVKNIFKFKNPLTYFNIIKMIFSIKKINPDIVLTFFTISNVIGILAARFAGVKCLISSRRDYGQWVKPVTLFFTKFANRFVTRILTNSFNVQKFTSKKERFPINKIDVIYNGIDLDKYRVSLSSNKALKAALKIKETNKIIGTVANLRPMKHLSTFILAAKQILNVRSDIHFILVGNGPCEQSLKALVEKLDIRRNVHFVDEQQDVLPYLSIFDVAINSSAQEGLSNAIMEYMAYGIPCIVSSAGGNTELIENGVNGYIFELDNYKELAECIVSLLGDKKRQKEFVLKSKEKVLDQLKLETMVNEYDKYFNQIFKITTLGEKK